MFLFSCTFRSVGDLGKWPLMDSLTPMARKSGWLQISPEKLTPYVKELGIRWVGTSKNFKQEQQSETCPPGLFCETEHFFHRVSRGWGVCGMGWGHKDRRTSLWQGPSHTGSTCGMLCLHPSSHLCPQGHGTPHWVAHVQMCPGGAGWVGATGHGKVIPAKETFQRDPNGCNCFSVLLSPMACQEEKVTGHGMWEFTLSTLSSWWGRRQLQEWCTKYPCGTWPAHTHGHKGARISLCGLSGALHSCSPMSQHCLLARIIFMGYTAIDW